MGVRVISDIRRFGPAVPAAVSGYMQRSTYGAVSGGLGRRPNQAPTLEVMHDGGAGKQGCPTVLAATDAWIDPSMLFRSGTNLGVTAGYTGGGNCVLYGSQLPSEYAYRIFDDTVAADLVTAAASTWKTLGTVAPATPLLLEFAIYNLFRVVFSAHPGVLTLSSR